MNDPFINTLLIFFCIVHVAATYFFYRINWVKRKTFKVIDDECKESCKAYWDLPSFRAMLYKYFWIWNFEKLRNKK